MVESKRDPAIGAQWLAWWALQGDEPLEFVGDYLGQAAQTLSEYLFRTESEIAPEDEEFLTGLHLVLLGLAAAADDEGKAPFKIVFKNRNKGKPINTFDRARIGNRAASIVEEGVREGCKQESAIAYAMQETGLSRSEIFSWLRHRRNWSNQDFREKLRKDHLKRSEESGLFDE